MDLVHIDRYLFPRQPYRITAYEPSALRRIVPEQIVMQPRLFVKILPRQPQRLLKVRPAVADVAPVLSKSRLVARPHQRAVRRGHLLHRARHVRVVIPDFPAFSASRHARYRRVRLFRVVQVRPLSLPRCLL